jgi:hypothetical protein
VLITSVSLYRNMHGGSKISKLPVEIWEKIFVDACVDGGFTGGSLALVSHHVHDASARQRLQSVSVNGSTQLKSLLDLLRCTPDGDRHVRFLYCAHDAIAEEEWRIMHKELITLIAPYIEVLTLYTTACPLPLVLPGVQLPCLRDLSIPGNSLIYI